jgi:hypothetical protein
MEYDGSDRVATLEDEPPRRWRHRAIGALEAHLGFVNREDIVEQTPAAANFDPSHVAPSRHFGGCHGRRRRHDAATAGVLAGNPSPPPVRGRGATLRTA